MSDFPRLLIRLLIDGRLQWSLLARDLTIESSGEVSSLTELPKGLMPRACWFLIPSQYVFTDRVVLPKTRARDAAKAIPFLLEDRLLGDVSQLYVTSSPLDHEHYQVWALSRSLLDDYLQAIKGCGYRVTCVLPDYFAVPHIPDAWVIHVEGDYARVRLDAERGFAVPCAQLSQALSLAYRAEGVTSVITCHTQGMTEAQQTELAAVSDPFVWQHTVEANSKSAVIQSLFAKKLRCNLLPSSHRTRWSFQMEAKPLCRAMSLAVLLWGMLSLTLSAGETLYYSYQQHKVQRALQHTLADLAVSAHTKTTIPQEPALSLVTRLSSILTKFEDVALLSFNYQADKLRITVRGFELTRLQAFQAALRAGGFHIMHSVLHTEKKALSAEFTLEEAHHA